MLTFALHLIELVIISRLAALITAACFTRSARHPQHARPRSFFTTGRLTVGYAVLLDGIATGFLLSLGVVVVLLAEVALRKRHRLARMLVPVVARIRACGAGRIR